ncbi:MAG TPA: hypothetical protein VKR06_42195 [Ktedonosporobacter sp.]|nr:hypothetical protein [Ktedonosporobacter sp.]
MYNSYTGLKMIHGEKVQQALERYRFSAQQETPESGALQSSGGWLARFTRAFARKPEATFHRCEGGAEGTL